MDEFNPFENRKIHTRIADRLEFNADDHLAGGRAAQWLGRFEILAANLLDGYGLRKSIAEFIHPPYGI